MTAADPIPNRSANPMAAASVAGRVWLALALLAVNGAPAQGQDAPPPPAFSPDSIAGPSASGAITQQLGGVFNGPGPITVGWLGAKKQIVVPRGPWVLLAAEDGHTVNGPPVTLTTLVMARIERGQARSLLLARFNSRVAPVRTTWSEARACEQPGAAAPFAWHETQGNTTLCVAASVLSQGAAARLFASGNWVAAMARLAQGGGSLPRGGALRTDLFFTGDLGHYLKVSRIDFGVSAAAPAAAREGDAPASAAKRSWPAQQRWAEAYGRLQAVGYLKRLEQNELDAGSAPTIAAELLPE